MVNTDAYRRGFNEGSRAVVREIVQACRDSDRDIFALTTSWSKIAEAIECFGPDAIERARKRLAEPVSSK